jgi:hypothetical protein
MSQITLKNFSQNLLPAFIKAAQKLVVRELDEQEKGEFVAYVDDKEDSFDVAIHINSKKEIIFSSCECKNATSFCVHKVAVCNNLQTTKAPIAKPTKIVKKKLSPIEELLSEVDTEELKNWLKNLFKTNKDIGLGFEHFFKKSATTFTEEEAIALTRSAVTTVIKRKRKADQSELKKIIDLWTNIHKPIFAFCINNITDTIANKILLSSLQTTNEYYYNLDGTTNKINKYVEDSFGKFIEPINNIEIDFVFKKTLKNFTTLMLAKNLHTSFIGQLLKFFVSIIDITNQQKKEFIVDELVTFLSSYKKSNSYYVDEFQNFIFSVIIKNKLFYKYYNVFEPRAYNNEYNGNLIESLIDINHLDTAELFCKQMIKANFQISYNIMYWQYLRIIYARTKNHPKLLDVNADLLIYTWNFNDYKEIFEFKKDNEERKKWRTKVLISASSTSTLASSKFYFDVLNYEGKYANMIDKIDYRTSLEAIYVYMDSMIKANRSLFLKNLFNIGNYYNHSFGVEEEAKTYYDLIITKLLENYTTAEIRICLNANSSGYLKTSAFYKAVINKL